MKHYLYDADGTLLETTDLPDDNGDTLRQAARDALAANRAFLAVASPTNAQTLAQVRALTRQMNGLARLVINQLDGTD